MQNSNIKFTMHISQHSQRSKISYEACANFFFKDELYYLFFDEVNDEGEITKCRFEIDDSRLRMRRNGPIIVDQVNISSKKSTGYIKTPFGHMDTTLRTFQYSFSKRGDETYHLDLGYDMYAGGEKTGMYLLEIVIIKKEN